MSKDYLTGKHYFKQTLFGLVLMVEYKEPDSSCGSWIYKWRKAKAEDLLKDCFIWLRK